MKITPEQIKTQLTKNISPVYFAFGKEQLLIEKTVDNIKNILSAKNFNEKIRFYVEAKFNWTEVFQENYNNSLFASNKIIEIRINKANINKEDTKAIQEILKNLQENIVIIIVANALTMAQKNSAWFADINAKGVIIEHWEIPSYKLSHWIATNIKEAGLTADKEIIESIAYATEGNLLASMQEINKLKLAYPDGKIAKEQYLQQIYAQYDYSVFGLIDKALIGDVKQINKIFNSLLQKGVVMLIIVNLLYKELKSLLKMSLELQNQEKMAVVLQKNGVWQQRQACISKALNNNSYKDIQELILSLGRIDQSIKGMDNINTKDAMRNILIRLAGFNNICNQ